MLRTRLDQQLASWKQIATSDIPALNDTIRKLDLPVLYAPRSGNNPERPPGANARTSMTSSQEG
jgi:hypothetical protein